MSHQNFHQGLPPQQSQQQQQQNPSTLQNVGQHLGQQQQQFLGHQIQSNMTPQQYQAWQSYYAQIGAHSQQPAPFMGHSTIQQSLNASYPSAQAAMPAMNAFVGNPTISGILQSQQQSQQMMFQTPQPSASPYVGGSPVSGLASLTAQQYQLLLAQQQLQQQQQQQFVVKQSQAALQQQPQPTTQRPLLAQSLPNSVSLSSTSSYNQTTGGPIPATSSTQIPLPLNQEHLLVQQQKQSSHQTTQQQPRVHHQSLPAETQMVEQHLVPQRVQKAAEDARLLAQKEMEAQAQRKAQIEEKQSKLVQEELKKKQDSATKHAQGVQERLDSIPMPIHLAGCHTLSKVSAFLPFPAEMASTSSALLQCFDQNQTNLVLSNTDSNLADYLGTLLADTTDQLCKIELKIPREEPNDLTGISPDLPLLQSIQEMSQFAFSVEPESLEIMEELNSHLNVEVNELAEAVMNSSVYKTNPESISDENLMQQAPTSAIHVEQQQHGNMSEMRRQMVSVGKQPKGAATRRKKDMVESLYDSLSGYFDSKGQHRRQRNKQSGTDDEDQASTTSNERGSEEPTEMTSDGEEIKKGRSRKRKRQSSTDNLDEDASASGKGSSSVPKRPPTPTEVIRQREVEWNERQRQREEKYRRRQQTVQHSQHQQVETMDVISENESFCRFTAMVDQVLEQMDDAMAAMSSGEDPSGLLLERPMLEELRIEAQKLKMWQKLGDISSDRLIKLLSIMEKHIRDVMSEDGGLSVLMKSNKEIDEDDSEETLRELIDERLIRSVDAALLSMCIMTSKRIPKQVLIEDIIERSVQLCKQCLQDVVYANESPLKAAGQTKMARKSTDLNSSMARRKRNSNTVLYARLVDLMGYFSELARFHTLNETLMFQLSSLCTPPFFIENVPEVQMQAIKLLPIIFAKCAPLRKTLLYDLLNSLHRLSPQRNMRNSYRISATESIGNFTVLILQLVQATVQLPSRKSHHHHSQKAIAEDLDDRMVLDSYEEAKKMAAFFLGGFLTKCTAKAEDDFRRLFEQFLQDILIALYRPMWPVAEMILTVLGNLLVMHFRTKTYDLSLRVASLEYLGIIAARLRKDRVHALAADATAVEKARLNSIVKSILFDENSYDPSFNVEDIDISHLSSTEKMRKLEQSLFDYIVGTMWNGDVSIEYILLFYAVEWYRETVLDVEVVKERYTKSIARGDLAARERQKLEQKIHKITEKGHSMKLFILQLMDKQHLKRRLQLIGKHGNLMVESDAHWVVKFLGSKKELSQSFEVYLRKILEGFNPDLYPVAIRAKAMKCLAQIVEADYQVLMIPEVNKIVQDRLIDANASVREATFDLIGKCIVSKPELLDTYYSILINRTKDTAVAVRKRVIRILRDIAIANKQNEKFDKNPQILSEIIQRVNDEEGVKKLCLDTFQQLWMQQTHDKAKLDAKVRLLVETAKYSVTEGSLENFELLISLLIQKSQEQSVLNAARQLVDELVEFVLQLEKKGVQEEKGAKLSAKVVDDTKNFQARLFATLTTLSFFAKARPEMLIKHIEVFIPYLSISGASTLESRVINQIITMLEQIIPLVDAYSISRALIIQLDTKLNEIAKDGGMLLIASAISCMSALHTKFPQDEQPNICRLFIVYYKFLEKCKNEMESQSIELNADRKPNLLRALYSMGLMYRHFDFDALLNQSQRKLLRIDDTHAATNGNSRSSVGSNDGDEGQAAAARGVVKATVFTMLFFFSRSSDSMVSQKALIALGQLAAGHPELLRRDELKNMYMVLLNTDKPIYMQMKIQVLKNIACFLFAEEQRAFKRAEETKRERDKQQRQQADESLIVDSPEASQHSVGNDLKEMELSSSGLSSSIIQQYWNAILTCYFHNDEMVRINAAQVIRQTLEQGLVTPGSSVPTLVAMSTDSISVIRTRVELLIRDMNTKYKGLILSKAVPGVRLSFQLQKKIRAPGTVVRGFRAVDNPLGGSTSTSSEKKLPTHSADTQALLGTFYINVRTNRQNRRSFLSSVLKLFSEEHKEKVERTEWLYLADNLAHFPYTVMDEPLYVIHQANSIISISGQNILSQFRQLLAPDSGEGSSLGLGTSPRKRALFGASKEASPASSSSMLNTSTGTDELEEFSIEYIIEHLPEDRTLIYELKKNSQACFILLHLKTFLMRLYGLKDDKVAEYSPSEAANVYEKPVNRRNIAVFSPDFILKELAAAANISEQHAPMEEERRKIAEDFHKFHEMLLSLDERRDDEEDTLTNSAAAGDESGGTQMQMEESGTEFVG